MRSLGYKFDFHDERDLSLVTDFYELAVSQCCLNSNHGDRVVTFDLFYRRNPGSDDYIVFVGLEEIIGYIQSSHFGNGNIAYLHSLNRFNDEFLGYLRHFTFTGDIFAVKEGTPVFSYEPLIRVKAKIVGARLLEAVVLLRINHQALTAARIERIVKTAQGRTIMEFGTYRAHSFGTASYGARAAFIDGVTGTTTTCVGQKFGMPVLEAIARSFIQSFGCEYDTFLAYTKAYPDSYTMPLDTYNTLKSGPINTIRVAKEHLEPNGYRLQGVHIDSGDIVYLSKKVHIALGAVGMEGCNIVILNSLGKYLIQSLISQEAQINSMGVGENLVCSKSVPVFGNAYKMSSIFNGDTMIPKIKVSEDIGRATNSGYKDLYRIYNKESGKTAGDLTTMHKEGLDPNHDLTIYYQMNNWRSRTTPDDNCVLHDLPGPIFLNGELVHRVPDLQKVRTYNGQEFFYMWDEILRFEYPQTCCVDLSKRLLDLKLKMLKDVKYVG